MLRLVGEDSWYIVWKRWLARCTSSRCIHSSWFSGTLWLLWCHTITRTVTRASTLYHGETFDDSVIIFIMSLAKSIDLISVWNRRRDRVWVSLFQFDRNFRWIMGSRRLTIPAFGCLLWWFETLSAKRSYTSYYGNFSSYTSIFNTEWDILLE